MKKDTTMEQAGTYTFQNAREMHLAFTPQFQIGWI